MKFRSVTFLLIVLASSIIAGNTNAQTPAITGRLSICYVAPNITTTTLIGTPGTGTWTSSNTGVASVNGSGVVRGISGSPSTAVITYYPSTGGSASVTVTVNPNPNGISVPYPGLACAGTFITLFDTGASGASSGGTWSCGNTALATINESTGVMLGISSGNVNITYTDPSTCFILFPRGVNIIGPGAIVGTTAFCAGSTISLTDPTTGGGTWSSGNVAVATISPSGVVTSVAAGTATISYSINSGSPCDITSALAVVTVNAAPSAGTITGATTVCPGVNIPLSDSVGGGVWSSSNAAVATVGVSGIVTGVALGTAAITYTVTNGCGTARTSRIITVNPPPVSGTITGASSVCAGAAISLIESVTGGVWSSGSTAIATVGATGIVTGVSGGGATITYLVSNACGSVMATQPITVMPLPIAGTISGAAGVCMAATTGLTDPATGGSWSSSNTLVAIVAPTGIVTGVSPGGANIFYSVTNSCTTATATKSITVSTPPTVGSISGSSSLCTGTSVVFIDAAGGGVWSSSNTAIATVSSSGVVTAEAGGSATIFYTVTNSCATATASQSIVVTPSATAGTIAGASGVCVGSTITLADPVSGGAWTSSGTAASVSGGIVSGIITGSAVISYSVTNSCGTAVATKLITVSTPPDAGVISGASIVCAGNTIALTDAAAGGVWSSSSPAIAMAGGTGIITGVSAGSATIIYSVTNACTTATATQSIIVYPAARASAISGASAVCEGSSITLYDSSAGGVWSTSGSTIATSVGTSITITGLAAGSATVYYSVTGICGTGTATKHITISKLPVVGAISGPSAVCVGTSVLFTDASFGGLWGSSDASATVSGSTVSGISAGSAIISYSIENICGTTSVIQAIDVVICPLGQSILTNNAEELSLYPNPTQGTFTLNFSSPANEPVLVTVTNIVGEKVKVLSTTTNVATNVQLDVPAGVYLVSAVSGQGKYMTKVVVK